MTPVEAARITAALSHIAGLLEGMPLADYLEYLREQRQDLPYAWLDHDPRQTAARRRLQALIAAGTKGQEITEEIQTAFAFWQQMRAIDREDVSPPHEGDTGPTVAQPGGQVLRPKFGRLAGTASCDCPMGECSHAVGLDGPA